jgi:SEC-C motif-containing protein
MSDLAAMCRCGSGVAFSACCGRWLEGGELPPTAEALMRSRFVAWATGRIDWIEATSTGPAARAFSRAEAEAWAAETRFTALRVLRTARGGPEDLDGEVAFEADLVSNGRQDTMREHSHFVRVDGAWRYSGPVQARREAKAGRNDPCPCGSGLKYKRCCGR